jgi:hypothetical protein
LILAPGFSDMRGMAISEAVPALLEQGWDGLAPTRIIVFGGADDGPQQAYEIAVDPLK